MIMVKLNYLTNIILKIGGYREIFFLVLFYYLFVFLVLKPVKLKYA